MAPSAGRRGVPAVPWNVAHERKESDDNALSWIKVVPSKRSRSAASFSVNRAMVMTMSLANPINGFTICDKLRPQKT